MTLLADFLNDIMGGLRGRLARAMPGPMLVRLAVWAGAVTAFAVAFPAEVIQDLRAALVLVAVSLLPAMFPRGLLVTVTIFLVVVGWLTSTSAYQEPVTAWRLVLLTGALYLLHTGAALAAVLPYDAVVSPGVLGRWLTRAAAVTGVSGVFGVAALVGAEALAGQAFVVASIGGVALVGVFAWMLARR